MRRKTLLLGISTAVLLGGTIGLAANLNGRVFNVNSEVKYAAKDIVLTIDANNVSTGSGSVTLNGNLFNYSNLVVENGKITLGTGARITAAEPSGNSVDANGMKGMGYDNMAMVGAGLGSATVSLNSVDIGTVEFTVPDLIEKAFGPTPNFDFEITSGSLIVSRLMVHYECRPAETPEAQKVLFVGADTFHTDWRNAYTEIMGTLEPGITVNADHFSTGSISFCQIGNLEYNYAGKAQEFRDKLFSENWDAVVYQLSRRITPSGTDFLAAEKEMFNDVIVPLTRLVTNNITLLAIESVGEGTVYDYDSETGQPVSAGYKETVTTSFMDDLVISMAYDATVKAGRYGHIYDYCDTLSSNASTKAGGKKYARGLMSYALVNETEIPNNIGNTWVSTLWTSNTSGAINLKNQLGGEVNSVVFGD